MKSENTKAKYYLYRQYLKKYGCYPKKHQTGEARLYNLMMHYFVFEKYKSIGDNNKTAI